MFLYQLFAFFIGSLTCELYAADNSDTGTPRDNGSLTTSVYETQISSASSISVLVPLVDAHIKQGVDPRKIWVVLDVDGTLTRLADPAKSTGVVEERGSSRAVVNYLWKAGVHLIFSSAWPSYQINPKIGFSETMQRLLKLNFGIDGLIGDGDNFSKGCSFVNGASFDFIKDGAVVSVHRAFTYDPYSRAKALAPHFYDSEQASEMQVLLFADDSVGPRSNTGIFQSDLRLVRPYPNLEVLYVVGIDNKYAYTESQDVVEKLDGYAPFNGILSSVDYKIKEESESSSNFICPFLSDGDLSDDESGKRSRGEFSMNDDSDPGLGCGKKIVREEDMFHGGEVNDLVPGGSSSK